ncbi:MAG: hypothetical protein Q8P35_00475 [Candidatus Yanofskybacteria bacterium]|nr:hypothetical protein [Candidatus Yanofskybacteria bacterium]
MRWTIYVALLTALSQAPRNPLVIREVLARCLNDSDKLAVTILHPIGVEWSYNYYKSYSLWYRQYLAQLEPIQLKFWVTNVYFDENRPSIFPGESYRCGDIVWYGVGYPTMEAVFIVMGNKG